ncbi:acyltransferase [Dyadobacter diqingensis]|uniref:acyltransferase n=1 Tax=Dyadobacter diqingensis TaxID=2938121 RepID=UPI0020C1A6C7|nr:acyltransferase [Dyadobacter diqingensis]
MFHQLINKALGKIRGDGYTIDPKISSSYLIKLIMGRSFMLFRGKTSLIPHKGLFFVGKNVTLKARNLMLVGNGVSIDDHCYIDALSKNGIVLGDKVSMGKRTVIECSGSLKHLGKGLVVEDNVGLGRDCFYGCAGGISIGRDTIIGNFVSMHSENHNASDPSTPIRLQGVNHKGISIGKNCWIGAKATILDGVTLGDGCIVAAGSVMTAGKYPNNGIYGGIPSKLIKYRF